MSSFPEKRPFKVACAFGTRPEVIKLFPLIAELERRPGQFETVTISTAQHKELLDPFLELFRLEPTHSLDAMQAGQSLNALMARIIERIDPVLDQAKPGLMLVQGDTATALAASLAAWNRGIPIGHVEAGLRTERPDNPFPEEMYRRLIDRAASLYFAPTKGNIANLTAEGVPAERIVLTGNTIVDALQHILKVGHLSATAEALLAAAGDRRIIVLTVHRRETSTEALHDHLDALARFLEANRGYVVIFPVHYNPRIRGAAKTAFTGVDGALLCEPLDYADFIQILARAWLVVSDSGGIQEEAPTLGKRVLILRTNTERPEVLDLGIGRLIGESMGALAAALDELVRDDAWIQAARGQRNPFGAGDSAARIADAILAHFVPSRTLQASYQ
jgi:UDP-N-acetylglucosamine 2-epimerase (non-hydrolysing)